MVNIDNAFYKFKENMELKALSQKFPFEIRGKGFMKGIWFYSQEEGFCVSLMENLLENGFIVLPEGPRADVLSLTPPLIANAGQYNKILNSIISILENK
jgi:4-aminobutyrate aminotransferase-like enzyme